MKIKGFILHEKLYQGNIIQVYRSVQPENPQSSVLKLLIKRSDQSRELIKEFNNEYLYLKEIDSEHVIKARAWFDTAEYSLIQLEDIQGITLKDHLRENIFSIADFMTLAQKITKGLADIHKKNIIHKDINPSNIIWNPQTGSVKIIDFNISSKFKLKESQLGNPEKLKGTLPYISPEQSGRMNCRVGFGSDLYSLGVTFYHMLTGRLPFTGKDAMEIVYAHLALPPKPLTEVNLDIPPILSKIIHKLLNKNIDERYLSAEGLLHDLDKAASVNFADFKLGEQDFSGKLNIPEKLYGRNREIETLLKSYNAIKKGAKEIVVVKGYSGTGKTSLVQEIHKPITRDRGHFISGKFDQLQKNVPYSVFIQAINQFCILILTENQSNLDYWKEIILKALGNLGKLLTDIVPSLELVISKQPSVPPAYGKEANNRFNFVVQSFFSAIATDSHPLVLFIDDLQWLDPASLNLITLLVENPRLQYFFFIGAYRDNEVSATHPLTLCLEQLDNQGIKIHSIAVQNLSREHIQEWLIDCLKITDHSLQQQINNLAGLIHQKTQGNAFFTGQFIKNLSEESLLSYDSEKHHWKWKIDDIKKKSITDNVADLLSQKLGLYSQPTQDLLKTAACIGSTFSLTTLSMINQKPIQELESILEPLMIEQIIYPAENNEYHFVHDAIYRSAYSLITNQEIPLLHLKIGRLLLNDFNESRKLTSGEEKEQLFKIVNHFNSGIEFINEDDEKNHIARLNLQAAHFARTSTAYQQARDYIENSYRLIKNKDWETDYDFFLELHNEAVQVFYLLGQYEEMNDYIKTILKQAKSPTDKALAHENSLLSSMAQNMFQKVIDALFEMYINFGVDISRNPTESQINDALEKTRLLLEKTGIDSIKNLSPMQDIKEKLLIKFFYISSIAFLFADQTLYPYIVSITTNIILEHGFTDEAPHILVSYAITKLFTGELFLSYQIGESALELLENRDSSDVVRGKTVASICLYTMGQKKHFKEVAQTMMDHYHYSINSGDFEYASYIASNYTLFIGRTDTSLLKICEKTASITQSIIEINQQQSLPAGIVEKAFADALLGNTKNPAFIDIDQEELFKGWNEGGLNIVKCLIQMRNVTLSILFEKHEQLLDLIEDAEQTHQKAGLFLTTIVSDSLFYFPLGYLQIYNRVDDQNEKEKLLNKIKEKMETLEKWADFGPVNFLHKYYLLKAELSRVTGKNEEAENYYDQAIEKALEHDYTNDAALINELAAKYYVSQKQKKLAHLYFSEALNYYRRWGAVAKVKQLQDTYPKYLKTPIAGSKYKTATLNSSILSGELLDIDSIIKASHALSAEVHLKELLEKMIKILIENAGAQRSILIVNENGQLMIQAEGTINHVSKILQAYPLAESKNIPHSVIYYAARSKKVLTFDNLSSDPDYATDDYVRAKQPKSAVCFPILNKGELSALLYLENNLAEGVFTPGRLEILNMLSTQIAISIENTQLYEQLEKIVEQRTNELRKTHAELESKHELLQDANKQIVSSINYARRIQVSILPDETLLEKNLKNHFVLWKPMNVVSGDFYWFQEWGENFFIALIDCTGHGVPGAFMSMMGRGILNHVVSYVTSHDPAEMLKEMNRVIKYSLKQDNEKSLTNDGMDVGICYVKPREKKIIYAGAGISLFYCKNKECVEIKGDRQSIGYTRSLLDYEYSNRVIELDGDETFYITSDGYINQSGGSKGFGFGKTQLKKLLRKHYAKDMTQQKQLFEQALIEYKDNHPQRDDITLIGFTI